MSTKDVTAWRRFAAVVAALVAGSAPAAESAAIKSSIDYQTTGTIDPSGISGPAVATFRGVDSGKLTTVGTWFDLGSLVVAPLPEGQSASYSTPITVTFRPRMLDGNPTPGAAPVALHGVLYGTVNGSQTSGVTMNFPSLPTFLGKSDGSPPDPPSFATFTYGHRKHFLDLSVGGLGNPAPAASGSQTVLRASITSAEAVPEPTALALLGSVGAALAIRRLRRCPRPLPMS